MKVKGGCCKEERKAQVRAALYGAWFESDTERDNAIDSFTKADLTISEIERLVQPLKEISNNAGKIKSRIFGSNNTAMPGGVY